MSQDDTDGEDKSNDNQEAGSLRRQAVEQLMRMADALEKDGVPPQIVMETMLAMGITAFVSAHGREATAAVVETLPDKIRAGAFGAEGGDPSGPTSS